MKTSTQQQKVPADRYPPVGPLVRDYYSKKSRDPPRINPWSSFQISWNKPGLETHCKSNKNKNITIFLNLYKLRTSPQ